MCGLFAVVPTIPVSEVLATKLRFLFRLLAKENDRRGGHSWGVWSHDFQPFKGLGNASDDLEALVMFTECWKPKRLGWIAGHTRYGTHGAKTVENSHPFQHGNLTLAHNGIVTVNVDDDEVQAHVVDSGQLCIAISKFGMEEALGKTNGMIGLLFNDAETNKFCAYRADQILHMAKCPWGYAISSDKNHLKDALDFAGFFDAEISAFNEFEVSAPWYEGFQPTTIKSGGLISRKASTYDWTAYRESSTGFGFGGYKSNTDYASSVYRNGKWVPEDKTPLPFAQEYRDAVKLVKGNQESLESQDLDALEKGHSHGLHGALHEFIADNGVVTYYHEDGPCDNCGSFLDAEGGFYFDAELPQLPLSFCSACLEDMHEDGFTNFRVFSAYE